MQKTVNKSVNKRRSKGVVVDKPEAILNNVRVMDEPKKWIRPTRESSKIKLRYENYLFYITIDEIELCIEVKAPTLEVYNNFLFHKDAALLINDLVINPSKEELDKIIDEYPAITDFIANKILETYKKHLEQLEDKQKKRWKHFESYYYDAALIILDRLKLPKNEDNVALGLLFLDSLQCLRHLRTAYTARK